MDKITEVYLDRINHLKEKESIAWWYYRLTDKSLRLSFSKDSRNTFYAVGNCPFGKHGENTFKISMAKNIFYCFECETGGDIYTFLGMLQNKSFIEVYNMLDSL